MFVTTPCCWLSFDWMLKTERVLNSGVKMIHDVRCLKVLKTENVIYVYIHICWWKTRAGPRNASNTPRFPKQSSGPSLSCRACCFPVDCLIRGWHSCSLGQLMGGVNSTELNPSCAPKRLKQHPNSHLFSTSCSSDMSCTVCITRVLRLNSSQVLCFNVLSCLYFFLVLFEV